MTLSAKQKAAQEVLSRRKARQDICEFARQIYVPGRPDGAGVATHHELILNKLKDAMEKPYGRLMIFFPPGSAKSTYASWVAPAYFMGMNPGYRVIFATYNKDHADYNAKKLMKIFESPRYQTLTGTKPQMGSFSSDLGLELENGSSFTPAGIKTGITGKRADMVIIDDPVKNREEADSMSVQDSVWAEYSDSIKSRLIPGGSQVLIMTRWSINDIAGRLLPEDWKGESGEILCRDGTMWDVLCVPAICEKPNDPMGREIGESLWPEWFDSQHWDQYRLGDKRTWASLYQQRPEIEGGVLFNSADVLSYEGLPCQYPVTCDTVYACLDTAFKAGDKNDGTAIVFFARSMHFGTPLIVLDWDVVQLDSEMMTDWIPQQLTRLEELSVACRARYGSAGIWVEDKAAGTAMLSFAAKKGWQLNAISSKFTSLGKDTRAISITEYMGLRNVMLSDHAYNKQVKFKNSTRNHCMSQVFQYQLGRNNQVDDLVDAFAYGVSIGLGNMEGM